MKNHPFSKDAVCGGRKKPRLSDSQTLTATTTACVDHSASTTGFHTNAETMSAFAAGDGRLEGALHELSSYSATENKREITTRPNKIVNGNF
jgi:hypothetical protein